MSKVACSVEVSSPVLRWTLNSFLVSRGRTSVFKLGDRFQRLRGEIPFDGAESSHLLFPLRID